MPLRHRRFNYLFSKIKNILIFPGFIFSAVKTVGTRAGKTSAVAVSLTFRCHR